MNRRFVLAALLCAAFLGACGDKEESVGADREADVVALSADADNTTQTVKVGDLIVVTLTTAGGSGYSWQLTTKPDAGVLRDQGQKQTKAATAPSDQPMTGTPENVASSFTAVGKGTTKLVLSHIPPSGGAAEATFTLTVVVR